MKLRFVWVIAIATPLLLQLTGCISSPDAVVGSVEERGPYLDAVLTLPNGEWRFFFPPTDECRAALTVGGSVGVSSRGHFRRISGPDGERCDAVGVGTLARWRRGRVEGEMTPSSQANWRVIHEDAAYFLLRGRFALASRVGVPNTFDVVAVVPNDGVCEPIVREGASNLTFRQNGSRVLELGRCPVVGVAMAPTT